eukprot:2585917-Amphidinium_carterae.1
MSLRVVAALYGCSSWLKSPLHHCLGTSVPQRETETKALPRVPQMLPLLSKSHWQSRSTDSASQANAIRAEVHTMRRINNCGPTSNRQELQEHVD